MANRKIRTFGEYIKELREASGRPQRKIAAELDIDPSLLGKIERDERPPTKMLIKKLAEIFNQNEDKLLEEYLSDQIANKVLEGSGGTEVLKVAEQKITYLKNKKNAGNTY